MSAFDDAIAQHAAHPACSLADPLTDSLCDQATRPAPQADGWDAEPIAVAMPWWLAVAAVLVGCFALPTLVGKPYPTGTPAPVVAAASGGVR